MFHRFSKKITAFLLTAVLCFGCAGGLFTTRADAAGSVSYWAQTSCKAAVQDGVISKYALNYDPQGNIQRQEFASIMANVLQATTEEEWYTVYSAYIKTSNKNFSDTSSRLLNGMYDLGLISGSSGKFNPTSNITRQEICVMFYNMFKYIKTNAPSIATTVTGSMESIDADAVLSGFADVSQVSSWAKDAVAFMVQNGFLSGSKVDGKLYLNPKNSCSREQAAVIGYNIEKQYKCWSEGNDFFIWKETSLYKTECETWREVALKVDTTRLLTEENFIYEIAEYLPYTDMSSSDQYYDFVKGYQTSTKTKNVVDTAKKVYDKQPAYVLSGYSLDTGMDCSGLVCWVINNCGNGWNVGRTTAEGLKSYCTMITADKLQAGDIVFENDTSTGKATHCMIYLGGGQMVETLPGYVYWDDYTESKIAYGFENYFSPGSIKDGTYTFGHLKQY